MSGPLSNPKALATGPFELIETPIHAKNMTVSILFCSLITFEHFKRDIPATDH
jgi:hypothetical protein